MKPRSLDHHLSANLLTNTLKALTVGVALLQGCVRDSATAVVGHSAQGTTPAAKQHEGVRSLDLSTQAVLRVSVEEEATEVASELGLGEYEIKPCRIQRGSDPRQEADPSFPAVFLCIPKEGQPRQKDPEASEGSTRVFDFQVAGVGSAQLRGQYTLRSVTLYPPSERVGLDQPRYLQFLVPVSGNPDVPGAVIDVARNYCTPDQVGTTFALFYGNQVPDGYPPTVGVSNFGRIATSR